MTERTVCTTLAGYEVRVTGDYEPARHGSGWFDPPDPATFNPSTAYLQLAEVEFNLLPLLEDLGVVEELLELCWPHLEPT